MTTDDTTGASGGGFGGRASFVLGSGVSCTQVRSTRLCEKGR